MKGGQTVRWSGGLSLLPPLLFLSAANAQVASNRATRYLHPTDVTDARALWVNPGGLGRIKEASVHLDVTVGEPGPGGQLRPFGGGSLNAVVKYGGVAALKDSAYEKKIKQMTIDLRERTCKELRTFGYEVIPSQANFFMVNVGRDVTQVAEDFKKRKVLVGRKFPPMNNWLRVSVGTEPEMARFVAAFKEMFPAGGIKTTKEEAKDTGA